MDFSRLDERPVLVAIAGPNGAGRTTFFHAHLEDTTLPFLSADAFAREMGLDAYVAAELADTLRRELVKRRESFIFETVFSDPVGDKVAFLKRAAESGYTVVVCFIGIGEPDVSDQRVAMRVSQGGHDVPTDKLRSRYPRTIENLKRAIRELPYVLIYDNDDLNEPYRQVAAFDHGRLEACSRSLPAWLQPLVTCPE